MKILRKIVLILAVLFINNAFAQQDISGTWQGRLELGPDTTLTVQFIMTKEADGSWSAVLNSPDMGGIKNIKAGSASFDGTNLKIDVAELSGAFAGVLKDGTFEGKWSQAGSDMDLNLAPYEKPVMSQAEIDTLLGEWTGKLEIPGGELTLVFRFAKNDAGELQGFVRSPDQGNNEAPATDILLQDEIFSMKVPAAQVQITGKMSATEFDGKFQQGPQQLSLKMSKGEYVAPKTVFNLSEEDAQKLIGEWHGELETPAGKATSVFRFEKNKSGEYIAETYSPDQNNSSTPISEVSVSDGTLTIKRPGPMGGFTGKMTDSEISGEVATPMGGIPLTLRKGIYVPPSYKLALSAEAMQKLEGKWQGKLNTPQGEQTVIFAFENKGEGEYYGYLQNPQAPGPGVRMLEANLDNNEFSMRLKFPNVSYKGTLSDNELKGDLTQITNTLALTLTKM